MTSSLRQQEEGEPLLPISTTVDMSLADEKAASIVDIKEDGTAPPAYHLTPPSSANNNNKKWDYLKKLVIAIALMMMGASTMKLCQKYSHRHHHHHHHHHNFKKIDYLSSSPLREGLTRPHGKNLPPFMHPPRPEECFALKDDAVHFNLTVSGFVHSVFLDPSLKNAKVDIESMPPSKDNSSEVDAPKVGAGFIGKYHEGRSKPGCTRKKSTVLVTAKSISDKSSVKEGEKETYICSLDLPFGQMGIGLFHGKPTKEAMMKSHTEVKHDEPKAPESFEPVSLKLRFPPGPYTVTSSPPLPHPFGHPPPPPPMHKGPRPHPHPHHPKGARPHHDHHRRPAKGIKIGCLKKKLRIMWKGLLPGQNTKHGAPRKQVKGDTTFILP